MHKKDYFGALVAVYTFFLFIYYPPWYIVVVLGLIIAQHVVEIWEKDIF